MRRPSVSVPCAANLVAWLSLVAPALASPQRPDLLPLERTALAASANGDYAAAAAALLDLAEVSAQDAASSTVGAARVEAWCTKAAALLTGVPADAPAGTTSIARLDRLRASPLATARPLLADRVGTALLELAGRLGRPDAAARAASLGALVDFALVGPFDNERGAGYARALPPERGLDLDAEFAGKRRPVRWRRLPPAPGDGALRLEAIVHPHEQSLVYLAAAVRVPAATHAVLELGTTGAFRVFCNGVEAGARDVRRELAYDQDAIPLALAAGANLLVLKLCHQEGSEFAYCARLRAPDGRPLAGFESSADDEALRAAAATTAVAPAPGGGTPPDVDLGGRTALPIDAAAGADALRAAWLWAARAADGDLDRRDRRAALRAAEALPDTAEAHLLVAFAHRSIGRAAADRDANERRRAIERALACAPRHVGALVLLGTLLYQESRLRQDALDLAARALAVDPAFAPAILLRADCHRDAGLEIMAAPAVVRAAEAKDATTSLLRRAADLLGADETRRELGLRMRVLERGGDADDRTAAAACLARTGRRAEAIALLEEAIARDPFARQARRRLADLHMAGGDARSAVRTLEAWLAIAPDDAEMLVLASACWRRLAAADDSAAAQQRALLDEALELEPNRRDDERYRDFLGAADTADAAAFHAPWQVDGEALVRTDGAPPADAAQKLDAVHWLLRQRVVRANGNGTTSDYLHVVVRILSVEGARRFATFRLPHFAGEQRARLLHCAIRRDDGTVLQPPLRGASVALSELRPGDVVDLAGRVDDLAPTFFGDYFGLLHHFAAGDGSPVRRSELVVVADPGRTYRWQAANGAPEPERSTQPGAALVFRWQLRELPRTAPEPHRPERREYEPIVRMTTYRDWDHFAGWWWRLIADQLEVTPAMRATVQDLCAGLSTTEAKVAAIYRFVTTDVRYEAWEFGVHGYKPYRTGVIHERRHGDCKDKTLLLCAMLGEIGVPCRPALVFADPSRTRDDLELALVQQFNHCIAWLPPHEGRPGGFLDGTALWHPVDTLPEMDQGAEALVVDAGRAEIRTVPWTTPAANADLGEFSFELLPDGGARVRAEFAPRGNEAVALRAMLGTEPARRGEQVERMLVRALGRGRLLDVTASDPLALAKPVLLRADVAIDEIGQRSGGRWQLPSTWQPEDLQALAGEPERRTPLLLGVPRSARQTVRYRLPPGWRPAQLPAAVAVDQPFGRFSMGWRVEGDTVVVERALELPLPRVAPGDYAAFRDFAAAVKTADGRLVLLQQDGAR